MVVQIDVLKSLSYCSGLDAAELDSLKKFIFEKTVAKGEIIFLDGEPAEALYFVVSGMVKIFKTSAEGKEQILTILKPRESFNDVPIFDGGPSHVSAQAMTPVLLYGIKKENIQTILREHPQIAVNINRVLAGQLRHLVSLIEDLSFKNVLSRVAKILLEPAGGDGATQPRLTQQEMAAIVGTAREMIGRSLKSLEGEGVIRFDRHRIIIADKKALEEIASTG
jgi:CRP-like cAMP-binding protein